IAEIVFAGEQPKISRLRHGAPVPDFRAVRAVAASGSLGEIEVGFIANFAAVATALVGLVHGRLRLYRRRIFYRRPLRPALPLAEAAVLADDASRAAPADAA